MPSLTNEARGSGFRPLRRRATTGRTGDDGRRRTPGATTGAHRGARATTGRRGECIAGNLGDVRHAPDCDAHGIRDALCAATMAAQSRWAMQARALGRYGATMGDWREWLILVDEDENSLATIELLSGDDGKPTHARLQVTGTSMLIEGSGDGWSTDQWDEIDRMLIAAHGKPASDLTAIAARKENKG